MHTFALEKVQATNWYTGILGKGIQKSLKMPKQRTKSQSRWEQEKMLSELQQAKEKRQVNANY